MKDRGRGDGLGGVVAAQSWPKLLLQACHVRVGAEEGHAGSPGRDCLLTAGLRYGLWEVLQQLV